MRLRWLLPGLMIRQFHVPSQLTSNAFLFGNIGLFFGFVGYGLLSQMIGRRTAIVIASCVVLVFGPALYYSLVADAVPGGSPLVTATVAAIFHIVAISPWGIVTVYIYERFLTSVRASDYGIGYSVAVVNLSFSGTYLLWLAHFMPYLYTPIVLLGLAGILMVIGALLGPETRYAANVAVPRSAGVARTLAARADIPFRTGVRKGDVGAGSELLGRLP